ncbi:zinc finger protein ZAT9-like [Fagus crenata]
MALIVDQQSNFKHFCKICKKGFGCGRALGGHMRAHGIGDESGGHLDDEDQASDWEDKLGGNVPASNKRMYALRTNPNRLKSCRVCENCGKEFLSWKAFLEHGKCSSEDAESLVSSPGSDGDDGTGRRGCGWSKRKRSLRAKVGNFNNSNCPSSEEEDLANCLMMLSNANVDTMVAEAEESCASASKEEERRNPMNIIPPISYRVPLEDDDNININIINNNNNINNKNKGVAKGLFECKACKKVFNSHQALGGHRASHKKVKGCYAARLDHLEDSLADDDVITNEEFVPTKSNSTLQLDQGYNAPLASPSKRRSKVHECSICHRIFSSGQALGGHKRCHWITSNAPDTSTLSKFHQFQDQLEPITPTPKFENNSDLLDLNLDLNLPAPVDDVTGARRDQIINPPSFEVSTDIFLQSWIGAKENEENLHHHQNVDNDNNNDNSNNNNINNNNSNGSMQNVDDEADSKVKLAKLSELKDMSMSGSSSPWLQVGIGSTTDVAADP